MGKKIAMLARNQSELADALDLTQQSISGKLCGRIAVTIGDLERLADVYGVPLLYFVTDSHVDVRAAQYWAQLLQDGGPTVDLVKSVYDLPEPFQVQLQVIARAVRETAEQLRSRDWQRPGQDQSVSVAQSWPVGASQGRSDNHPSD
jgi:transcriptional regulator with XRE-family HTH domain